MIKEEGTKEEGGKEGRGKTGGGEVGRGKGNSYRLSALNHVRGMAEN